MRVVVGASVVVGTVVVINIVLDVGATVVTSGSFGSSWSLQRSVRQKQTVPSTSRI